MEDNQNLELPHATQSKTLKQGKWTSLEDVALRQAVTEYGGQNWNEISQQVDGRSPIQCLHRWKKILAPGLRKGKWDASEDKLLRKLVNKLGTTRWSQIANHIEGRTGEQCRKRWINVLNPSVSHEKWSAADDKKIINCFHTYGAKWTYIASQFPGRNENQVKNRFYICQRQMKKNTEKLENSAQNYFNESKSEDPMEQLVNARTFPALDNLTSAIKNAYSSLEKMKWQKIDEQPPEENPVGTLEEENPGGTLEYSCDYVKYLNL